MLNEAKRKTKAGQYHRKANRVHNNREWMKPFLKQEYCGDAPEVEVTASPKCSAKVVSCGD